MQNNSAPEYRLWTPANIVTIVRIVLVPVFVIAFISPWPSYFPNWPEAELLKPWVAAFLFVVLACTDALDGHLARSRGEVTNFGKFIDPLADKILVAAALLALVELQLLPSWVALIIIVREFIVSGLRMLAADRGVVIAASWYGKAKTVFQIIAIVLFIIKGSDLLLSFHSEMDVVLYVVSWLFMIVALVLTIISMLDYFVKAKDILGFGKLHVQTEESSVPEDSFYGSDTVALAREVVQLAEKKKILISTAESCTGGLIGGSLTAIPGSSEVVCGGIISYSNDVKEQTLGVSAKDLETYGAVSDVVARQMAEGSRKALGSTIAVSVTGVAGPGGGSKEKPVGTVWFGLSTPAQTYAEVRYFKGKRDEIRAQTVLHALELLRQELV